MRILEIVATLIFALSHSPAYNEGSDELVEPSSLHVPCVCQSCISIDALKADDLFASLYGS